MDNVLGIEAVKTVTVTFFISKFLLSILILEWFYTNSVFFPTAHSSRVLKADEWEWTREKTISKLPQTQCLSR